MTRIALVLVSLLFALGCKSAERTAQSPEPTPTPAPATDDPAPPPEAKVAPAPPADQPSNALRPGAPVRKTWGEGGPGEVVWKVASGDVTLVARPGKPEGVLTATYEKKQQHVTNFKCDVARPGSEAAFALTPEGKVLFRAAVGPDGKDPGSASVFLLEWRPDKGHVFVANGWTGAPDAEPPAWAKL